VKELTFKFIFTIHEKEGKFFWKKRKFNANIGLGLDEATRLYQHQPTMTKQEYWPHVTLHLSSIQLFPYASSYFSIGQHRNTTRVHAVQSCASLHMVSLPCTCIALAAIRSSRSHCYFIFLDETIKIRKMLVRKKLTSK
jgi:hypothetical protein